MEDQPVGIEGGAEFSLRDHRIEEDVVVCLDRPGRRCREARTAIGAPGLLELGQRLGELARHRAEYGNISFDTIEPAAHIGVGDGVDPLAQHLPRLGIGRQQAGQILDSALQPCLRALAQAALHQHDGDRAKGNRGDEGLDR